MLRNSIYMHGQINQAARWVADGRAVIPPNESPIGYIYSRRLRVRAAAAVLSARPGTRTRLTTSPAPNSSACAGRPRPSRPPSRASRSRSCKAARTRGPASADPPSSSQPATSKISTGRKADELAHSVRGEQDGFIDAARAALVLPKRRGNVDARRSTCWQIGRERGSSPAGLAPRAKDGSGAWRGATRLRSPSIAGCATSAA